MAEEKQEDWTPSSEEEGLETPMMLRRRPVEDAVAAESTNSSKRSRRSTSTDRSVDRVRKKPFLLPNSLQSVSKSLDHMKKRSTGLASIGNCPFASATWLS